MNRFWDRIVQPVFYAARARNIVGIGCSEGEDIQKTIDYCLRVQGALTGIDPSPHFNPEELMDEYGWRLSYFKDLSLRILPRLYDYDAVIIDGDPNWYTVYHELKSIENMSIKRFQDFPLVMVHNIGQPYGRRDRYYNPDNIPEEHRQPYGHRGIICGPFDVADVGEEVSQWNLAVFDGGERNGVFTAVEDFLKETTYDLTFHQIADHRGLGILVPTDSLLNNQVEIIIAASGMKVDPISDAASEIIENENNA